MSELRPGPVVAPATLTIIKTRMAAAVSFMPCLTSASDLCSVGRKISSIRIQRALTPSLGGSGTELAQKRRVLRICDRHRVVQRQPSPVDVDRLPREIARVLRGEERRDRGDLVRVGDSAE